MKTFEYVTILFSILLGVCITQMSVNVVLVVQNFRTSVLYAPPILWNAAALLAILAHWVHFYKARNLEVWSALQLTIVFITPLIYFIPATLVSQAPVIDGRLNYEVLFETNKNLIYFTVLLFACFTMAQNHFIYKTKKAAVYIYYSLAIAFVIVAWTADSKAIDLGLSIAIVVSEIFNHYVINPLRLS
jgi:hypothetical protein